MVHYFETKVRAVKVETTFRRFSPVTASGKTAPPVNYKNIEL